jgi:hypothetical protein
MDMERPDHLCTRDLAQKEERCQIARPRTRQSG